MGNSVWAVLLRTMQDLHGALDLVMQHNALLPESEERGEALDAYSVVRFRGKLYLCMKNGGGRDATCLFLELHRPRKMRILWPLDKPNGFDYGNYIWRRRGCPCCTAAHDYDKETRELVDVMATYL